jgi:hypothetical protein
MNSSSSAPQLANSPYAQVLSTKGPPKRKGAWAPPPGAFNNPDMPKFDGPGPGRYTPSSSFTKPRVTGTRFGSEDRFKYLGPQLPLTTTGSGMSGMYTPQTQTSPGPGYMPKYTLTHSMSRVSSFSVERRDTSGVAPGGSATNPGPGLYTPSEKILSTKKNYTPGGAFLADDRHKYLGQVDPDSGQLVQSFSPGPLYRPSYASARPRAPTVAFGGRGPGTIKKPPKLMGESPGPGAYEHNQTLADGARTSTKPRAPAPGFGSTTRSTSSMADSSMCFHGKVPVDMANAKNISISPGPGYNPSVAGVKPAPARPIFGTSKRVTPGLGMFAGDVGYKPPKGEQAHE